VWKTSDYLDGLRQTIGLRALGANWKARSRSESLTPVVGRQLSFIFFDKPGAPDNPIRTMPSGDSWKFAQLLVTVFQQF
jgi:hypothetical protein